MNIEKFPKWLRAALSPIAFWVIILLSPYVIALWNAVSPYRMAPGTIEYLFFSLVAQPVSCFLACHASHHIAPGYKGVAVAFNSGMASVVFIWLIISTFINQGEWTFIASHLISIATLCYCCIKLVTQKESETAAI